MVTKFEGSWYNKADYVKPEAYPQMSDYVICKEDFIDNVDDFLSTHIGQIVSNKKDEINNNCFRLDFMIQYNYLSIPKNIRKHFISKKNKRNCRSMRKDEIIHFSKNREELEALLRIKKYNL